jgi:hypothetical protein
MRPHFGPKNTGGIYLFRFQNQSISAPINTENIGVELESRDRSVKL